MYAKQYVCLNGEEYLKKIDVYRNRLFLSFWSCSGEMEKILRGNKNILRLDKKNNKLLPY